MNKPISVLHHQSAVAPGGLPDIAASIFRTASSRNANLSFEEMQALLKMEEQYPELKGMDRKDIRVFFARKEREIKRDLAEVHTKRERLAKLEKHNDALHDVLVWSAESGLKIERPDGPSFRQLRKAVAEGHTVYLGKDPYAEVPSLEFEKEVFRHAEIIVVEHDWAAAFEGANVTDASIRLPYDVCAFEFKFAGRPVIALATQFDTEITFCPAIQCGDLWVMTDYVVPLDGFDPTDERNNFIELIASLSEQIRAACIALDAEVARADVVREPYSGDNGKTATQPLKSHHIVSLVRRSARALPSAAAETGRHVRLHFRRGHWRHFDDHRTWIKWMLVGDPDLGFVEKEYRL